MLKDKYEISIWKDKPVYNQGVYQGLQEHKIAIIGSDTLTSPYRAIEPELVENINGTNKLTFKMFYRCKDQSIGDLFYINQNAIDDSILTQLNPELRANRHFDEIPEEGYENPFISFMVNERKVKLKWKDKWYDFIIKNCQEDSDKTTVTYTCTDAYINELSKNGYGLTFDNELMNNQGTAAELAARIVAGTDWHVVNENGKILAIERELKDGHYTGFDKVKIDDRYSSFTPPVQSDSIYQKNEEPVMVTSTSVALNATRDGPDSKTIKTIPSYNIYVFYPPIEDLAHGASSGHHKLQFGYVEDNHPIREDESLLITNAISCTLRDAIPYEVQYFIDEDDNVTTIPEKIIFTLDGVTTLTLSLGAVSTEYRAERWHEQQECEFDPKTGKYCNVYQDDENKKYYYFRDVTPVGVTAIVNLLTNPSDFVDADGWVACKNLEDADDPAALRLALYPKGSYYENAHSYLRIYQNTDQNIWYYNAGLTGLNSFLPDGFQKGTKYVCMYQVYSGSATTPTESAVDPTFFIGKYNNSEGIYTPIEDGGSIVTWESTGTYIDNNTGTWNYKICTVKTSVSRMDLVNPANKVGFFIKTGTEYTWIKNIQFYLCIDKPNSSPPFILPNGFADYNLAKIRYNVYSPNDNTSATSLDGINFKYQGLDESAALDGLTAVYNGFKKIRTINGKQSNRFNLLQIVAEQFNCWVCFYTVHKSNGEISIQHISQGEGQDDEDLVEKYIYLKEEKGVHRAIGFVYGIDLKTIQRTIQSDNIVTRTIVNPNNNEFAPYGSCNIVRAQSNYSKSNSIFDFGYLTNTGILDAEALQKDLYGVNAYLPTLRRQYTIYDNKIAAISLLELEKSKIQGFVELYEASELSARELETKYLMQIGLITGTSTSGNIAEEKDLQEYIDKHETTENITELLQQWRATKAQIDNYQTLSTQCQNALASINSNLQTLYQEQNDALKIIRETEDAFFQKYSQYIQEGTWQNEDYMDDDLYYLDAINVAYTSSRPQISYNISVIRLSSLEEFQNKVFNLGDISFIQDPEFFGYVDENQIRTPYKEKIIITEYKSYLDEPEKDNFTVQNYRSSFDDLFQRITATTQSLQYHEGEYARAANAFTTEGALKAKVLQDAFNENKDLLMSSNNNRIIQDENGITLYSVEDPGRQVRINANGLFITTDNGANWLNAIRSTGVATETLSAGSINAANIAIVNGAQPALTVDERGFTSYNTGIYTPAESSTSYNVSYHNQFVRMDKYGIYGIDASQINIPQTDQKYQWYDDWMPGDLDSVTDNATFYLTWNGFGFKGSDGEIFLDNDGIRIHNKAAGDVFTVDNDGNLTLSGYIEGTYFYANANGAGFRGENKGNYFKVTSTGVAFGNGKIGEAYKEYLTVDEDGNAKFTGDISAASGTFSGTINAQAGSKIGAWYVNNNGLYNSETGAYIYPTQLTFGGYGGNTYGINYQTTGGSSSMLQTASLGDWQVSANRFFYSKNYQNAVLSPSQLSISTQNSSYFSMQLNSGEYGDTLEDAFTLNIRKRNTSTSTGQSCMYRISDNGLAITDISNTGTMSIVQITPAVNTYPEITLGTMGLVTGHLYGTWDLNGQQIMTQGSTSTITASQVVTQSISTQSIATTSFSASTLATTGAGGTLSGYWSLNGSPIATTSDQTLKKSILSIPLQYTTLFDNLRPVIYKYNDGTSDRFHIGFIAQDVEQAILDASLSTQDFAGYIKDQDDICYLRYEEFIALNTWQIQHLKSRVAELESRLAALEATKI